MIHGDLTERIIGAAISVHREVGPGLLESTYQSCFEIELGDQGIPFEREVQVQLKYKTKTIPNLYKIDFIVDKKVIVELKAIDKLALRVGLLFNFNVDVLKHGMRRIVL